MQQALEATILIALLAAFASWIFIHWRFRDVLRREYPELAKKLSGIGLSYSGGLEWIDFALRKGYLELESSRLKESGDLLVSAYGKYQLALVIGLLLLLARFAVSLLATAG